MYWMCDEYWGTSGDEKMETASIFTTAWEHVKQNTSGVRGINLVEARNKVWRSIRRRRRPTKAKAAWKRTKESIIGCFMGCLCQEE